MVSMISGRYKHNKERQMLKKRYFKTNDDCEVTFEYGSETAAKVALVTEFNGWEPVKMKKRKSDGMFYAKMRLPKDGRYQFRYLVDGEAWDNDSAADEYVANEYGAENSVVTT
jgi:1,4-alpha-glucan branching enzyme